MSEERRQNNTSNVLKANNLGTALFIFVVLAGAILWFSGNLHFGSQSIADADATDTEHEHEHESESLSGEQSIEEAMCEHGIRTIDCDKCRFEVGVVKLQPSVANTLIETIEVQDTPRIKTLTLTGQVQLDQTKVVDVVSTGSGQVKQVEKLLGQEVTKGVILAVIYSADLGQAKAQFLEVQARLKLATSTFEREKGLHEKKISSEADYLSASSELEAAQAYYAAAEKRLRLFGLETEQINSIKNEKENGLFAELVLRAPQSGTIITQNISTGALIDTSESLYTIADLSNVWVWYDLYEKDLAVLHDQLASGRTVTAKVRVKAFEGELFDGVVDLIGSQIDEPVLKAP